MNRIDRISDTDPEAVFQAWIESMDAAAAACDAAAIAELFTADGYWKDLLALTWEFKTFSGRAEVKGALERVLGASGLRNFRIAEDRTRPSQIRRSGQTVIEGFFEFDTAAGVGSGFVRLIPDVSDPLKPKVWQLLTSLHHLHGFEEQVDENRPSGERFSKIVSPVNWKRERDAELAFADREPEVLIVGAGQSGLMLAARLRQMGVDALVIEKTARIGDIWRDRYDNLTLHNELYANHFPYMPFPTNWPLWLPKDMLAGWLEAYAELQELNVWTSVELVESAYDSAAKEWRVSLRMDDGAVRTMRPKHLVAALGVSGGAPKKPDLPGLSDFAGAVLHSSEFRTGLDWSGKRAIVVGTGNSGHDVAQDLYVSGAAEVSIMQRGATCVVSLEPSAAISYSVYTEGRPIDDVDLMVAAIPYPVLIDTYQWITRKTDMLDKELIAGLNAAGFKTHSGEDKTGFQLLYLRGAGGYYIDVGCSQLIIDGKMPVLQADDMDRFTAEGLRLKNGETVACDLVVLATGFEGMQAGVRQMLGDEIADRIGPIWGFDEDCNLRNMWKRTAQEGFWVMGGAIVEARIFSRYLAVQIKAALEGLLPDDDALPLRRGVDFDTAS